MQKAPFTLEGVFRLGWELTKANIGFLVGYQLILFFFVWMFSGYKPDWRLVPLHLIGIIILILGKMGLYKSAVLLTKGLKPSFDQFYKNWRLIGSWVIASFLFGIAFAVGLALFIFPGLYLWAMFGFYPFLIVDKGLGPIEALKKSAKITEGNRWPILLFFLACVGLDLLGILVFGVGILITIPVTLIAMVVVYEKLTGQTKTSIQPDEILQ